MHVAADPTTREDTAFEDLAVPFMRQLYPVALRLTSLAGPGGLRR